MRQFFYESHHLLKIIVPLDLRQQKLMIYLKNTHRLTVKQSRLVPGPGGVGEVWRVTGGPLARSVVCRGRLKDSPCE